jgi:hypothetical protein
MGRVLVLTAPAGRGLADDEIAVIAREAGGGAPRRLGRAAAEIPLESLEDLAALRAAHPGIDVNAVAAGGRRKRLLIADMDSTNASTSWPTMPASRPRWQPSRAAPWRASSTSPAPCAPGSS